MVFSVHLRWNFFRFNALRYSLYRVFGNSCSKCNEIQVSGISCRSHKNRNIRDPNVHINFKNEGNLGSGACRHVRYLVLSPAIFCAPYTPCIIIREFAASDGDIWNCYEKHCNKFSKTQSRSFKPSEKWRCVGRVGLGVSRDRSAFIFRVRGPFAKLHYVTTHKTVTLIVCLVVFVIQCSSVRIA